MTAPDGEPLPAPPPASAQTFQEGRLPNKREAIKLTLQIVAGAVLLFGVIALVGYLFKPQLEAYAASFVDRFGVLGMAVGTYLADGFHVPIPPQVYMAAAIKTQTSPVLALGAISIASILAGATGYFLSRKLANVGWIKRLLARSAPKAEALFKKYGYWSAVLGGVLPVPYSTLCYAAGLYRMPPALFGILAALRVPRLIVFWFIVKAGLSL